MTTIASKMEDFPRLSLNNKNIFVSNAVQKMKENMNMQSSSIKEIIQIMCPINATVRV